MLLRKENAIFFVFLISAILFVLILPYFLSGVQFLGYRIPQSHLEDDYLKGFITGTFLFMILAFIPFPKKDRKNILIVWAAKLFVTLFFMLFYEYAYGLDAYWYFQRSQLSVADLSSIGWGQGTANLAYVFWYFEHRVVQFSSYHTLKVFSSFMGFIGIYLFYRGIINYLQIDFPKLFLFFGLFPSVLFWSSILGKDPLILLGIGLCYYGMLTIVKSRQYIHLVPIVLGLFILAAIRLWMVPIVFFPFLLGFLLKTNSMLIRLGIIIIAITASLYSLRYIGTTLEIDSESSFVDHINYTSKAWQRGGSAGSVPELSSMSAVLKFLPIGMFTALFRPLPFEILTVFGAIAGLENFLILVLLFNCLKKKNRSKWKQPVIIWFTAYVLLWALVYAFISPQNLGSSVRFKLQVLLPLLGTLFIISNILSDSDENKKDTI
ncbi:MAG: hypothetical protein M9962_08045 [Oligoflexia bacterium]|nr:hypothetical protein [Oligoflexia bacterium]